MTGNKLLYNSRIISTYLKLTRQEYPFVDVEDLLAYAGMEIYQVEDEGHWFSQEQINLFQERLVTLSGNRDIAREAGAFTASPQVLGGIRRYLLGLASPARAYVLLGRFTGKFTKSSLYESRKLGSNKVEAKATPYEGVREEPFQCRARLGYLEAISRLFHYRLPKIEHPECLFEGGSACRYIVSWQESPCSTWRKARALIAPVLFLFPLLSYLLISPHFAISAALPIAVSFLLLLSWYISVLENLELRGAVFNLQDSSDELIEQVNINYKNSQLINEIGQTLNRQLELDGLLQQIARALESRLDYDRGLIMLANHDNTRLLFKAGYGYSAEQLKVIADIDFHLDKEDSQGMFVVAFKEQVPFLLNNIDEVKDKLSSKSYQFAMQMGAKSFICCPIVFERKSLGILAVDNLETKRPLLERDKNLLMGVANQVAISIHNVRLVATSLRQFQSILQVLVASTDARDPVTSGHSLRVTRLADGICRELGLPSKYRDMIRVASLLHDYGKIGVDDSILKKPGRLTPREYEEIKTHALKTRSILEKIEFEDNYKEVPEIAGCHHEKLDGTGYPHGLKNGEIPLGAKIIAVADVFEALTAKRHYREPVEVNDAFDLLVRKSGAHFDIDCVEALIKYYNKHEATNPYAHISFSDVQGRLWK